MKYLKYRINRLTRSYNRYITTYKKHGIYGVVYKFLKKIGFKIKYNNFIEKKKYFLGQKIVHLSKNTILNGPYKGTKFLNKFDATQTATASLFLGFYEQEVQKKIIELKERYKLKYFVNFGAGEGFHCISLLNKFFFDEAYAFEIDNKMREIIEKNSVLNRVNDKIKIFGKADFTSFKENFDKDKIPQTLFLVDIEGAEFKLFDEKFLEFVSSSCLIIENHDFAIRDKESIEIFLKLINKKFIVENVKPSSRNPYEFEQLDYFEDDERWLMISEGRPCPMNWYVLLPKITKNVTFKQ